jgi:hypothetical protein
MQMCTRGKKHIGATWSRNTCLAQSLVLQGLEEFQCLQRLINNDQKQAIQRINKTIHQTVFKY